MVKYRNPREMAELEEDKANEEHEKLMAEPATTVEEETWKKRYGDARRHLDQIKRDADDRIKALENKLDQALRGQIKAPKSKDEVAAWAQEYPEFASILESIVADRIDQATRSTNEKIAEFEEKQRELTVREAKLELQKIHPDSEALFKDPKFAEWLEKQDEEIQNAILHELNVKKAAFVLNMYKQEAGTKKSKVDEGSSKDAAKVVRTPVTADPIDDHGDYDFSESQIERESKKNPRWFDANEEAIMTAMRKGRILMDISGGAR
jgi:hypothetical protein